MPFPDRASDVTVLNTWSDGDVMFTKRGGTLASGKARKERYTIEVKSEPLLLDLNEFNLGQVVAEAWRSRIRDNILGISASASEATQRMRVKAGIAVKSGAAWARDRYTRRRPPQSFIPNQTNKLFNDSGLLADGIHVRQNLTDATYTINFPVNRFNPETFGAGFGAMLSKFRTQAPMMDPKKALGDDQVEKAIHEGLGNMMAKAESNSAAAIQRKLGQLRAARKKVLLQIARLAAQAAGF